MSTIDLPFKTLTPMWTGGADRNSGEPRETGLIGSMRWWYEGIVREMGGKPCDSTTEDTRKPCELKQEPSKSFAEAYKRLCPVCKLFGCTGWRRRFRLDARGLEPQSLFFVASSSVYQSSGNWLWRIFGGEDLGGIRSGGSAATSFTLGAQALWGRDATLRVTTFGEEAIGTQNRVAFLLNTMARWGALGAKPQHGFGQIAFTSGLDMETIENGRGLIAKDATTQTCAKATSDNAHFSLDSFFSNIYELAEPDPYRGGSREIGSPHGFDYRQHFIPCAFDIRYKSRSRNPSTRQGQDFGMRPWFRDRIGREAAHVLFGRSNTRRDDLRSAGRIQVSHLYKADPDSPWLLKVWGHVPSDLKDKDGNPVSVDNVGTQVADFITRNMFKGSKLVEQFDKDKELRQ